VTVVMLREIARRSKPVVHVIGPEEAIHLQWAPHAVLAGASFRAGAASVKVGRPPIDPVLRAELRAELEAHLQAGGNKRKSLYFVQRRLKARGLSMNPLTIRREIIWKKRRKV
jgi:hypothetical protein